MDGGGRTGLWRICGTQGAKAIRALRAGARSRHYREGGAASPGAGLVLPVLPRHRAGRAVSSTGLVPFTPRQQGEGAGGKLPAFTFLSALSTERLTRFPPFRRAGSPLGSPGRCYRTRRGSAGRRGSAVSPGGESAADNKQAGGRGGPGEAVGASRPLPFGAFFLSEGARGGALRRSGSPGCSGGVWKNAAV